MRFKEKTMSIENIRPVLEQYQLQTDITPFFEYDTGNSYILSVSGNDALPLWYRLRSLAGESGLWPVVLGTDDAFAYHRDHLEKCRQDSASGKINVSRAIEESLNQSSEEWFRQRRSSLIFWDREEEPAVYSIESSEPERPEPLWHPMNDIFFLEDNVFIASTVTTLSELGNGLDRRAAPSVVIALFPTTSAWHIPAYLQLEGFNDSPDLAGQLCVWRWWQRLHQAEIVSVLHDAIEAWVAKPALDPEAIERLDWEQFVYAPDLDQVRAGELDNIWVWRFWWD
jgi:hypothetical protein